MEDDRVTFFLPPTTSPSGKFPMNFADWKGFSYRTLKKTGVGGGKLPRFANFSLGESAGFGFRVR